MKSGNEGLRFQFGRNWKEFSKTIDEEKLFAAKTSLRRLLPAEIECAGSSFLDIGSGSGIHSIAAHQLGFWPIKAIDYDIDSVEATSNNAMTAGIELDVFQDDILDPSVSGTFDVVYSWGVLHHTGDMEKAIKNASSFTRTGGFFAIAIYVRTPLCGLWRHIKRFYCSASPATKVMMGYTFHAFRSIRQVPTGELFGRYSSQRGMSRYHDSIDWLGGYPYDSASEEQVVSMVGSDFKLLRSFSTKPGFGLFGTGCAEYVFQRLT